MQMCADTLDMPIKVAKTGQSCALGAAMMAATACGCYKDIPTASEHMGGGYLKTYTPDPEKRLLYEKIYQKYRNLGKMAEQVK